MRLSDLQNKTVINVIDGKNVGNIIDLEINENGEALGLVVEKYKFLISSFGMKGARIQMRSQPWISYQTKERKSLKQSRLQIIPRDQ